MIKSTPIRRTNTMLLLYSKSYYLSILSSAARRIENKKIFALPFEEKLEAQRSIKENAFWSKQKYWPSTQTLISHFFFSHFTSTKLNSIMASPYFHCWLTFTLTRESFFIVCRKLLSTDGTTKKNIRSFPIFISSSNPRPRMCSKVKSLMLY